MPSSGDGTKWDETLATNSGLVSDTGLELREIKKEVRARLSKEHINPLASGADYYGGEHINGSAVAFYQSTAPTKRPWAAIEVNATAPDLTVADAGRLFIDSDNGSLYFWDGAAWITVKIIDPTQYADGSITFAKVSAGFAQGIMPFGIFFDKKADGTNGGGFSSGAWQTRALNFTQTDSGTGGSLAANQLTLGAGTFRVEAIVPAYKCNSHQARLRNITTNATVAVGTVARTEAGAGYVTYSHIVAEFTNVAPRVFEIQHQCETTRGGDGFGVAGSFGSGEFYTMVKVTKLV
jgi:hypothetical protein